MHTKDYEEMGMRIRAARKKLKLTQEQASECCDITASFYGNIERGDKIMSVETLVKVSKGLSVSADYILFGEEEEDDSVRQLIESTQKRSNESQFKKYMDIMAAIATVVHKL